MESEDFQPEQRAGNQRVTAGAGGWVGECLCESGGWGLAPAVNARLDLGPRERREAAFIPLPFNLVTCLTNRMWQI